MIRKLAIVATLVLSALVGVTTGQPAEAAPVPAVCAPAYLGQAGGLNTWQRGNAAHYCLRLHARSAITTRYADGTVTRTPAGPVLVRECVAQYRGVELVYCLAQ